VTLKSALTLDGQLALPDTHGSKDRVWISGEESQAEVQKMRHAADALLTGIGTILADNPLLTDRSGLQRRRKLLRIIVDSKLRLSTKARIVQTADDDLLVFTLAGPKSPKAKKLQNSGVKIVQLKPRNRKIDLNAVMKQLGKRDILSVLLEAGPRLNGAALAAGLVHKLVLFYAPKLTGHSRVPLLVAPNAKFPALHIHSFQQFGPDLAIEAYLRATID
jgi:diaminohydroxyphosphoribosylaminopyrimidine deaminase/5-amino-6-(5-phosphoribosylamino)uracil reductase